MKLLVLLRPFLTYKGPCFATKGKGPTLSYLALLGFIYFTFSHFIFKEIKFDLIGNRIDGCLPINEYKSRKMVVLLQSYTMILHVNFINFIDKWFDYSILCFSVALE